MTLWDGLEADAYINDCSPLHRYGHMAKHSFRAVVWEAERNKFHAVSGWHVARIFSPKWHMPEYALTAGRIVL